MKNDERGDFSTDAPKMAEPAERPADPANAKEPLFPPLADPSTHSTWGKRFHRFGFGNLLAVLILLAAAFALLAPPVSEEREAGRRIRCGNYLKQIALAMHNYADVNGSFPPAYTVDSDGRPLHSWRTLLLPFLEKNDLYEKIRLDEPWDSEWNKTFHREVLPIFCCPSAANSAKAPGVCFYSVVVGEGTCFPGEKAININEITDGTSNTVLLVERKDPICWMRPDAEITLDEALKGINAEEASGIGSSHPGGCNVTLADGANCFISEKIDPNVWKALLLIDDGPRGAAPFLR